MSATERKANKGQWLFGTHFVEIVFTILVEKLNYLENMNKELVIHYGSIGFNNIVCNCFTT